MSPWKIREANADDCDQLILLIKEMADSEGLSHMLTMTPDRLKEDCFGPEPFGRTQVIELQDGLLIGYAMYFYTYSTFEGRSVYLEDIFIKAEFRSKGLGTALWRKIAQIAIGKGCKRCDFITQSFNEKAIKFYESKGAINVSKRDCWQLYRLEEEALQDFAA